MKRHLILTALASALTISIAGAQTVYFSDEFDSAAVASDYSTVEGLDPTTGQSATVEFGYDYSAISVPEAPNSSGSGTATSGLSILGNVPAGDATQFTTCVYVLASAFSGGVVPTGDVQVTVDYYYGWTAGSGSTQTAGLSSLASGTKVNNLFSNDGNEARTGDTDGYNAFWNADYGFAAGDIGFIEGVAGTGAAPELDPANAEFTWGTFASPAAETATSTSVGADGNAFFEGIFGTPDFIGAWITARLSYVGGVVSFEVDNGGGFQTVCQYDDVDDTFTSGTVGVLASDFFATSQNDTSYHIFDNLVVEEYVEPTAAERWTIYE